MNHINLLFGRHTTKVEFAKEEAGGKATLRNQDSCIEDFGTDEIEKYIRIMAEDEQQFVVLKLPEARYGVRFVQASVNNGQICVQLGIEKKSKVKLVEKSCSEEECKKIFFAFFLTGRVECIRTYRPVKFMK